MTRVLSLPRSHPELLSLTFIIFGALLLLFATQSRAVSLAEEAAESRIPGAVETGGRDERVIVAPEPPWDDWSEWHDGWNVGGPRIDVWVDRGDWSVYRPGDRISVFFRVDRPCYVTIVDYTPDGGTHIIFPSRWSGSNFVYPGRTYRIPESRGYSLRVAGPGGEETLFACAHSAPWPSVSGGYWLPPYPPRRGRVVVGRPGGYCAPGRHGRVVLGCRPGWPVPPAWQSRRHRWGCDSVTFQVQSGHPWSRRGSGWRDDYVDPDDCYGYHDYDDYHEDHRHGGDGGSWYDGDGLVFRDEFRMTSCSDSYHRSVEERGCPLALNIQCIESRRGGPTEIIGRIVWEDGWGSEELFRLDVDGRHGDRPLEGRSYSATTGDAIVTMIVEDFRLEEGEPRQAPSIEAIEFEIEVRYD